MIYISGYQQALVRFHLRSDASEKRYFSVVLFRLNFGFKFEQMNLSIMVCLTNLNTCSNY